MQINAGAANGMGVINKYTNLWNDTAKNADPNDPSVKDKFMAEQLEPALEQFQSGFTTEKSQAWARSFVDRFREHMNEKTSADMSSMAADAVHMNVNKSVNLAIGTVSNDPSSLDFLRDSIKGAIGDIADSSPNLTPQANAKVKNDLGFAAEKELVHAAISGTIANGGDWQKIANDPKNAAFINRPELDMFAKAQKAQERREIIENKQIKLAEQQETDDKAEKQITSIMGTGVKFDQNGTPQISGSTVGQLWNIVTKTPDISDKVRKAVQGEINWIEAKQNQKKSEVINDDPKVLGDLTDRLLDPTNPTTRLQLLMANGRDKTLSDHTFRRLDAIVKEVEEAPLRDPAFKAVIDGVKGALGTDPVGHEKYGQFMPGFIQDYLAKKRAGTLPPNALNIGDEKSMISQAMKPLMRTMQQRIVDGVSRGQTDYDNFAASAAGQLNVPAPSGTKSNPVTLRQNGHTYQRQPDGKYKAID
jgi:hypothetical protein